MKILVVDDHALFRDGVRHAVQALGPDVEVLEAQNADDALKLLDFHADVGLVLLDLMLPGVDGFSALEQVRKRYRDIPVVVISVADDRREVVDAINMGAAGFIPKSSRREVILQALKLVLSGGVYIPPQILGRDERGTPQADGRASTKDLGLTERQGQILRLVAQGKPNKIIAHELDIAEATVKAHMSDIFRALRVTNRAQAALAARKLGFD